MKQITVYSKVGNPVTTFDTDAETLGDLMPEFWDTVGVIDTDNLKIIEGTNKTTVKDDFVLPEQVKLFITQNKTDNGSAEEELAALKLKLVKLRKAKKSTRLIVEQIESLEEQLMNAANAVVEAEDDINQSLPDSAPVITNVSTDSCIPSDVAKFLLGK